jgi:hypothetical protein
MTYALLTAMATDNRIATSEPVIPARHQNSPARNPVIRYRLQQFLPVGFLPTINEFTKQTNLFRLPLCLTDVVK